MAILINIPGRPLDKLISKLSQFVDPDEIQVWPDVSNPEAIEFALVWKHESSSLLGFPNLKGISSFGAGVDSILKDVHLPEVPIARIVDADLAHNMANYVLALSQHHSLRLAQFSAQQRESIWKPKSPRKGKRVGVLGYGQLGRATVSLLSDFGYDVSSWSRAICYKSEHKQYSGPEGLTEMASKSDILVCLLPLTEQTENILNSSIFSVMPNEAAIINVARGGHLNENDLLGALELGQVGHAYLDVFNVEPLPQEHPFWLHPKITVTPHISAVTNIDTALEQVVTNYQLVKTGQNMINCIDRHKGY